MSLLQRKTALKILKKYNNPKPKKFDMETQTDEAIDNKWKVMYEIEKARLKEKVGKLNNQIDGMASEIRKLNVELSHLTRNYANINEQYR